MALNGLLSDFGVIELVQYPHNRKRTGELQIVTPAGGAARCYYKDGKLVHVVAADKEGFDALVDVVCLEEGEFKFNQESTTEKISIEMDLHRAIMQALKVADERKKSEEEGPILSAEVVKKMNAYVEGLLREKPELYMIAVVDTGCVILSEAFTEEVENRNELRDVRKFLCDIVTSFPVGQPNSIIINHDAFVVTAGRSAMGMGVVIIGPSTVSLGMVNMLVKRSATEIDSFMGEG